jgi:hypothetical protein
VEGKGEGREGEYALTPLSNEIRPSIVGLCQQSQELLVGDTTLVGPSLVIANTIASELLVAEVEALDARVVA